MTAIAPVFNQASNMLLQSLIEATETKQEAIEWARSRGLMKISVDCANCHAPMGIISTDEAPDFELHRCQVCHSKRSIRTGSFAFGSRLSIQKLLLLMHHWLSDSANKLVERELELTNKTVTHWFKFFRGICAFYFSNISTNAMIGGPGVIVEIDETLVAKRKYHRGRLINERWVFGGLERRTDGRGGRFAEFVGNRSQATLLPVIQRRIRPGTTIISDGWGAYRHISQHGYQHHIINHSQNFVSPGNRVIHTQGVENQWRQLKRWLRSKGTNLGEDLQEYITEWLYKKEHSSSFDLFIEHISLRFQ